MLKTALLILTLMPDGGTRMTLTEAEDAADCDASRDVVTQILTEAGNPPLAAVCGETALRLSPFVHGVPPEAEIHRYRVEVPSAGGFMAIPLSGEEVCAPAPTGDPVVHCARSAQMVLPDS